MDLVTKSRMSDLILTTIGLMSSTVDDKHWSWSFNSFTRNDNNDNIDDNNDDNNDNDAIFTN